MRKKEKLICIDTSGSSLTLGKIYLTENGSFKEKFVGVRNNNGDIGSYHSRRFKPVVNTDELEIF